MKKFLILLMMTIFLTGCGGETETSSPAQPAAEKNSSAEKTSESHGKILVAYFSRADDNYNVGVIEKGNTEIVAEMIQKKTGADIFRIKPVKNYPVDYRECTEVAKTEKEENARPEITGKVEDMNQYDTIFLGYPIWWSDLPMAVYTFLEGYDLSGKKIIPFCTHEGSGLGATEKFIADKTHAEVLSGFAIQGAIAQNDKDKLNSELDTWLKKLGF